MTAEAWRKRGEELKLSVAASLAKDRLAAEHPRDYYRLLDEVLADLERGERSLLEIPSDQ